MADYVEDWKAESIQSVGGSRLACMTPSVASGFLAFLGLELPC